VEFVKRGEKSLALARESRISWGEGFFGHIPLEPWWSLGGLMGTGFFPLVQKRKWENRTLLSPGGGRMGFPNPINQLELVVRWVPEGKLSFGRGAAFQGNSFGQVPQSGILA